MRISCQTGQGAPGVRNYIQLRAVHYNAHGVRSGFPDTDTDLYEFGSDDSDLMRNCISTFNFFVSGSNPAVSYSMTFPNAVINWNLKLDKSNILDLARISPGFFFTSTVPEVGNTAPALENLVAVNLSPRNTFPTDLGTDGQRLARNKLETKGGILQFIARLFFLTSNPALFQIWNQLKTSKLTPKKALDEAKQIAHIP
jgi:hypothetical protein